MGYILSLLGRGFVWLRVFIAGITMWQWIIFTLCVGLMIFLYVSYGQGAVAAMGRKFFIKTLPMWWRKFVIKALPKLIGKAFASRYGKRIIALLVLTAIGKKIYDFLEEARDVHSQRLKNLLIDQPKAWWLGLGLGIQIAIVVSLVIVIGYFLGYKYFSALVLFFDIALIWTMAVIHFFVPRIVAGKIVDIFHKTIGVLWQYFPERVRKHPKLVERQQQFANFYKERIAEPADKARDDAGDSIKTFVQKQKRVKSSFVEKSTSCTCDKAQDCTCDGIKK